jgi:hypothetical protein
MARKFALAVLLTAVAGVASATPPDLTCHTEYFLGLSFFPYEVCTVDPSRKHPVVAAPEIDAASAVAGLTFMVGGLAMLRGRRSKIAKA